MSNKIVLTTEEKNKLQEIRTSAQKSFLQLGQIQIEKRNRLNELEKMESNLIEAYDKLLQIEQQFIDELNKKYGEGELNIQTGEFTPTPDSNK